MSQPVAAPETLLSADKIASRIRELGAQITQDYAGRELVLEAYRQAVDEKYRFYSYGDCMLIL